MASSEALSEAELSVENSLLRIERMKLREALAEALNGWQRCLDEDHGEGVEVMGETDRIAELRKLLEGTSSGIDAPQPSA